MTIVLQGALGPFGAGELLLLLAAREHSGTFTIEGVEGRARFWFGKGRLLWAEPELDAILERVLAWRSGTFSFTEDVALPDGAKPKAVDIAPLVEEAEKRVRLFPDPSIVLRVVNQPAGQNAVSLSADEFNTLFLFAGGRSVAEAVSASGRPPADVYPLIHKLRSAGLLQQDNHAPVDATVIGRTAEKPRPKTTERPKNAPIGTLTDSDGVMHPLLEEVSTIGRLAANDIPLTDGSVSSRHARITRTHEGFVIEDLASRNGTYVNSEKLSDRRLLADGDLVRLGKVLLTFNLAREMKVKDVTQPEVR
jgi:FHA domain/Domain of unknown function (DUF4388)